MQLRTYRKSILREVLSSKARFISILVIIFLGVSFYCGIKATGPNMGHAVENYYKSQNLMDSKIVSSLGLTDKDLDLLKNSDKVESYEGSHTIDANLTNINNVVRFMEYNPDSEFKINNLDVIEGRLPENEGEIALDKKAVDHNEGFKIGDTYSIDGDESTMKSFGNKSFKIVGIVNSSMYIENPSRGITTVGKGSVDYFAIINSKDITMDAYTEAYVKFKNVDGLKTYGDEYKEKMDENRSYLKDLFVDRGHERVNEIKEEMTQKMSAAAGLSQMSLSTATATENLSLPQEAKYYYFDRNDNPGFSEFKDIIKRLDNIASVFPVFFFAIAVLICLTTMTRMVEENRIEIGTLKSLGYSDFTISKKFIIYAATATLLGSILGILLGYNLFPNIIYKLYGSLYTLPTLKVVFYPSYMIQGILISLLCTVGASLFVLRVELKNNPSSLMKVKAPKMGKKILIERITPLWNKFNFNMKVTLRNIFRYKQRMIMTVLGIAGCMAMLITGFGLKDSISGSVIKQFDSLWKYQGLVSFKDDEKEDFESTLKNISAYDSSLKIHHETVTFSKDGINKQTSSLYVPDKNESINDYMLLNNRVTGEKYSLSDDGIIINEKLAKLLGAKVGDSISLENEKGEDFSVKIDKIYESYLAHAIYLSKAYYNEIFGHTPSINANLIKLNNSTDNEDTLSTKLMENQNVVNVTFLSKMEKNAKDSTSSLSIVVVILIVASGALAFVVLYNLTNINVSERIRELSTIKVLGFFDNEVTMYLLRENIILTVLGIITGSFLGKVLHRFIITTAENDNMMMSPTIHFTSFFYSAVITAIFSMLVMIMMHIKLKKIDMIDALKSNE